MRRMVAVILAAQLVGGCSFAFVSGPPANHRQLPVVECTTSRVAPILDTIWTALQTLNFIGVAAVSDQEWSDANDGDPPFKRSTGMVLYASLAALGGAGMYYGFSRTGACRSAKAELMVRQMGGQQTGPGSWPPAQPQPYPGTWPPPAGSPPPAQPAPPAPPR